MNRNDWLLFLLYLSIAMFIAPHSCARPRNRCAAITVPNGRIALRHRGRVGKFFCNKGYKLIGDRIATCHEGRWDAMPNCVKDIECPEQKPKVMNGKMILFNYVYFKVVCNPGFRVPDGIQSIFPCEQFFDSSMEPPVCQLTAEQFCDFETDMCSWNNTVPYFPWIRQQNATPSHSLRTGPGGDHTYGTGYYLYIETSGISSTEERYAKLVRHFWKVDTPEVCFVFWYHMFGFNIGTLDVYVDYAKVFTKTGNLGDKWRKGIIQNLPSDRDFYISVVATTGNGYAGDIAIDDIGLVNSTDCTKLVLIETTCKYRCFEMETNATLCKCSSECLIEANCCSDFMQFCGADASQSTLSSESTEETTSSQDTDYSTMISNPSPSDDSSTIYGSTVEPSVPYTDGTHSSTAESTSYEQESSTTDEEAETLIDDVTVTTNSVIKITETRSPKHWSRNYHRVVSAPMNPESSHSTSIFTQSPLFAGSAYQDLTTVHPQPSIPVHPLPVIVTPMVTVTEGNEANLVSTNIDFTKQSTISYKPTTGSNSSLGESRGSSVLASFTRTISVHYDNTSSRVSVATSKAPTTKTTATTPAPHTKKTISSTSRVKIVTTTAQQSPEKPTVHTSSLPKNPKTTSSQFSGLTFATSAIPTSTFAVTSLLHQPNKNISTTRRPMTVTTIIHRPPEKPIEKLTPHPKESEITASSLATTKLTTNYVHRQTEKRTEHPDTQRSTYLPSTVDLNEENEDVDESTELVNVLTSEAGEEFPISTTSLYITIKPSEVPYKRRKTYVPKGRYTFSAVRSENKTTTYVTVVAGILLFLAAAFFAGYVFRRRRSHLLRGSPEESDVLYMTTDEILDFNLARSPHSSGQSASSSSQQMLCQTEY